MPDCYPLLLFITNGRSAIGFHPDSGAVLSYDRIVPEDLEAFQRFADAVHRRVDDAAADHH